jgi:hypothetical protein
MPASSAGQKSGHVLGDEAPGRQGARRAHSRSYATDEQRRRPGWIAMGAGWPRQPEPIAGGPEPSQGSGAIGGQNVLEILTGGTRQVLVTLLSTFAALAGCSGHRSLGYNLDDVVDAAGMRDNAAASDSTGDMSSASPTIPKAKQTCPPMAGLAGTNVTFLGNAVTIWSGPSGSIGPMVFYWHAASATSQEAVAGLGLGTREVVSSGGVIAAFNQSNRTGTSTGDSTWYTGDFDTADEILACAKEQGLIDVTHIHSAGYSPGSCQTAAMVYARAYLASVICYSGGAMTMPALPDPGRPPALLGAHGAVGKDIYGIDIAQNTLLLESDLKGKGSFVIDCDDGGDHLQSGAARITGAAGPGWQFLKDHPYGVNPEPYGSLPSTFPSYCKVM